MSSIDFFFELASPYSYLASLRLQRIAADAGRIVEWRPIEIEVVWGGLGVLEAYTAIRRVKHEYIARDAQRCAAAAGISLVKPVTSARATAFAKLAFYGLRHADQCLAQQFIQAVWRGHFEQGLPISNAHELASLHECVFDEGEITSAAQSPQARAAQDISNADAIQSGCFGVPWIVADGETYFGQDRLSHLSRRLNGNPPV